MGLSENERWRGLMYHIDRLTKEIEDFQTTNINYDYHEGIDELEDIVKECEGIWHKLLGGLENDLHWLVGSDSGDDEILSEGSTGPWGVVITDTLEEIATSKSHILEGDIEFPFDPLDELTIHILLSRFTVLQKIFLIYRITECMIYPLRRYDDKFKENLYELDKTISNIQGKCFRAFNNNREIFTKAKLLRDILVKVYGQCRLWRSEDPVRDFLLNIGFSCRISEAKGAPLSDIINLHLELCKHNVCEDVKNCDPKDCKWVRLKTSIQLMGTSITWGDIRRPLMELVNNDEDLAPHEEEVKRLYALCERARHTREEEEGFPPKESINMYGISSIYIKDGETRLWEDETPLKDREFRYISKLREVEDE